MAQFSGECYKAALPVDSRCNEYPESVVNEVNASQTIVR